MALKDGSGVAVALEDGGGTAALGGGIGWRLKIAAAALGGGGVIRTCNDGVSVSIVKTEGLLASALARMVRENMFDARDVHAGSNGKEIGLLRRQWQ